MIGLSRSVVLNSASKMHLNIIIVFDSGANLIKCVLKKKNSTNVLAETRYPDENLESVFVFGRSSGSPSRSSHMPSNRTVTQARENVLALFCCFPRLPM